VRGPRPPNSATPCASRNKEYFARRVFSLWDCCTNVVVRRKAEDGRQTESQNRQPGTALQPLMNAEKPVLAAGMVLALDPKKGILGVGLVGIEDTFVVTPEGGRSLTGTHPGLLLVEG
jgi:Xaa-Pro aminopeptidase